MIIYRLRTTNTLSGLALDITITHAPCAGIQERNHPIDRDRDKGHDQH